MISNYYEILGVSHGASLTDIKRAYRQKAKEYHPDINGSETAHDKFVDLNEAYAFLLKFKTRTHTRAQTTTRTTASTNRRKKQSEAQEMYREWAKRERAKAKARAEAHARMKFEEFKKTATYKTAQVIYSAFDVIFIIIGFLIIAIPITTISANGLDPEKPEMQITALIFSTLFGSAMIFMLVKSKLEEIKNKRKQK